MSKITLSVIVYAPCLKKTTIKSTKKQMISWMTRYFVHIKNLLVIHVLLCYQPFRFCSILLMFTGNTPEEPFGDTCKIITTFQAFFLFPCLTKISYQLLHD